MPMLSSNGPESGEFAVVAAVTREFGIGCNGKLPWHPKRLQLDMAFLKFVTTHRYVIEEGKVSFEKLDDKSKNTVIMGRRTWDSIPTRFKPMENRFNIIITRDVDSFRNQKGNNHPDVFAVNNFDSALQEAIDTAKTGQVFILGLKVFLNLFFRWFECI
jgi:dihydrofolate reductase